MIPQKKDRSSPVVLSSIFLILCVIIFLAGYFFYMFESSRILSEKRTELFAISKLKVEQVVHWRKEKYSYAKILMAGTSNIDLVKNYLADRSNKTLEKKVSEQLESYREIGGFRDAILFDPQGNKILQIRKVEGALKPAVIEKIKECAKNLEISFIDIHEGQKAGDLDMDILVPLKLKEVVAVSLLCIDAADFLFPIIQSWPAPSPSSETLLVRREGNEVVFLNKLRHKKDAALKLKISLEKKEIPAVQAILGFEGVLDGPDYRGVKVVSAVRQVPGTPWALVAKTDIKELKEPLKAHLFLITFIIIAFILLFGVGLSYYWMLQKTNWVKAVSMYYEYITKYANDIIFLFEDNFKLVFANEKASQVYGYTQEEFLQMSIKELRAPEVKENVVYDMTEVRKLGGFLLETLHQKKDGKVFPIESSIRFISIDGKNYYQAIIRDITERKQAEEILKKSRQELQIKEFAIQSSISAIGFADMGGKLIFTNKAYLKMWGYEKAGDILGKHISEFSISKEQMQEVTNTLSRGQNYFSEGTSRRKDGKIFHLQLSANLVTSSDGKPICMMVSFMDITEKKKIEESIRAEQLKYKELFEHIKECVAVYMTPDNGENFFIVDFNKSAEKLEKVSKNDILGKNIKIVFPGVEEFGLYKVIQDVWKTGNTGYHPISIYKDEKLFGWRENYVYKLPSGEIVAVYQDVSESKKREKLLSETKEQLDLAVSGSRAGLWDWKIQTGEMVINEHWAEMLGYSLKELTPISIKTWERLTHPEDLKISNELSKKHFAKETEYYICEVRMKHKDGRWIWIIDRGRVNQWDKDGKPVRMTGTHFDINENKKAEEAMLQSQKLESLGVIAGGIAHDFNNILMGIFGNIEMARLKIKDNPGVLQNIDTALESFGRAKDLTQQLLTFSKGGAPVKKTMKLGPLLIKNMNFVLSGSNVIAKFDISEDMSACEIDENQIGQVIDNITINAMQSMPAGGTIFVRAFDTGIEQRKLPNKSVRYVVFEIKDHGIGIPAEMMKKIFDPFFTTKQKGSGLGLSTVYSIVKKHEGYVNIESELGKGTTMSVYLPASKNIPEVLTEKKKSISAGAGRILIMDDEDSILKLAKAMLEGKGYTVETVKDGGEALSVIGEAKKQCKPFNLVIMDLTISGGMGGKEAVQELRKIDKSTPVVCSSGFSDDEILSDPKKFDFTDKLSKPYLMNDLLEVIAKNILL